MESPEFELLPYDLVLLLHENEAENSMSDEMREQFVRSAETYGLDISNSIFATPAKRPRDPSPSGETTPVASPPVRARVEEPPPEPPAIFHGEGAPVVDLEEGGYTPTEQVESSNEYEDAQNPDEPPDPFENLWPGVNSRYAPIGAKRGDSIVHLLAITSDPNNFVLLES